MRLTGGTVVSLDPPRVERRDLLIAGGRFAPEDGGAASPEGSGAPGDGPDLDCTGCLVVPGLVVGHTHAYSALATGMPGSGAPPRTFREILERVWWRLDRALDAETLEVSALVAAAQAVRAGVTCLFDHHESPGFIDGSLDVIARAFEQIGIRGVLAYGATDRHGAAGAREGIAESERFAKRTRGAPLVRGMIGLHAPFTCADGTLEAGAGAAASTGAGLHFHAAEGPDDQTAAGERWGVRLIPHLERVGLLGERTLIAHAVDIDAVEAESLAERRCFVAHQPRSNMNNGVGYAGRIQGLDRLVLGTDGVDQDVLAELRAAFFRRREHAGPSLWPDAPRLLAGGHRLARAFLDPGLGTLAPGAPADVTVFAHDPPTPLEAASLGAHLVFGMGTARARDVFVGGRQILRAGRLTAVDEVRLAARAREVAPRLWARMPPAGA